MEHHPRSHDEELDESIERVTVSNVWIMNEALTAQLARYAFYKRIGGSAAGTFANHCVQCGAVQHEYRLHSEPGDVFFSVTEAESGSMSFTTLEGEVRMSGDYGFGV